MKSYWNKNNGIRKHRKSSEITEEDRRRYKILKSLIRATRTKQARVKWDINKTKDTIKQLYNKCRELEKQTGIKWQIDHIIPLKGKLVSGLHVWNNLQILPAIENIKKGNKYAIY